MRATDLLGAQVLRADGTKLGAVLDVRLVQDGPLVGADCALRIQGLVVGSRRLAAHLGYDRAGVRGPALVAAVVRRLTSRSGFLPWSRVTGHEPGLVQCDLDQLEVLPDLADQS